MSCAICKITGVFAYRKVNGASVCVPCLGMCKEALAAYVADVIHKAPKTYPADPQTKGILPVDIKPFFHGHKKIQSPDDPSDREME